MKTPKEIIASHIDVCQKLYGYTQVIEEISQRLIDALNDKGKILIIGNGGSAADSQHMAAELVGRFKKNRPPIPAIALTTDTSILTAVGNDFGFEEVFCRQVEALGQKNDILLIFSTSGNSKNLIKAANVAKNKHITTIALLGKGGGKLKNIVDLPLVVQADDTPRIQEMHILIIHIISEIIEQILFPD